MDVWLKKSGYFDKKTLPGLSRAGDGIAQHPRAVGNKKTLPGLSRAGDGIAQHPRAVGNKKTLPGLSRAGDGTRTHDLLLGKETFYQLNHARVLSKCRQNFTRTSKRRQPLFSNLT